MRTRIYRPARSDAAGNPSYLGVAAACLSTSNDAVPEHNPRTSYHRFVCRGTPACSSLKKRHLCCCGHFRNLRAFTSFSAVSCGSFLFFNSSNSSLVKALLYSLISLLLFQCGADNSQATSVDPAYSARIARFSSESTNPYPWGATTTEMAAWASASHWKPAPQMSRDKGEPLGLESVAYWKDQQEVDYQQLITLLFKHNRLVAIDLSAAAKMDAALKNEFDQTYEKVRPNVWRSTKVQAAVRRDDSRPESGINYLIADLKLRPSDRR